MFEVNGYYRYSGQVKEREIFHYSSPSQHIEIHSLFNDSLKPPVTQSVAVSEPFELRLSLSLKNDKNILSYSLLYRAFS